MVKLNGHDVIDIWSINEIIESIYNVIFIT